MKKVFNVVEFYDWHNSDPEIIVSSFEKEATAQEYLRKLKKRVIRSLTTVDAEGYKYCEEVETCTEEFDYIFLQTSREDYITLSIQDSKLTREHKTKENKR